MEERLQYLFDRYCSGICSPEEKKELSILCLLPENQKAIEKLLESTWDKTPLGSDTPDTQGNLMLESILQPNEEVLPVRKINYVRWMVAASIIIIGSLASYFFLTNPRKEIPKEVNAVTASDIKSPENNKATITLANGTVLHLDSAVNGQLAMQGDVKLVKLANGQIAYETSGSNEISNPPYNILSNPRGSKIIDMELADGSHVWLNTGSSIKYPVAFTGKERKVFITGEAYFEIAHNSAMPFKVANDKMEVTVLGTKFNVNAYDDETDVKVTLVQGAVKVKNTTTTQRLLPGEQARITTNDIHITNDIDLDEVMAWRSGKFIFGEKANIETVMHQVARWYDVEIEYQGKITSHFGGTISRQSNISELIKVLEATGHLRCRIEGKKLIISP